MCVFVGGVCVCVCHDTAERYRAMEKKVGGVYVCVRVCVGVGRVGQGSGVGLGFA